MLLMQTFDRQNVDTVNTEMTRPNELGKFARTTMPEVNMQMRMMRLPSTYQVITNKAWSERFFEREVVDVLVMTYLRLNELRYCAARWRHQRRSVPTNRQTTQSSRGKYPIERGEYVAANISKLKIFQYISSS